MKSNQSDLCPCQSGKQYAICCGPFHKGKIHAPTAETLMRSRYTAYAQGNAQYIYRTWHEKTRPSLQSLRDSEPQALVALKIVSTLEGGEDDQKGMVEFIATYESPKDEPLEQHKEKSLFVRAKGRWVYIDAV